MWYRLHGADFAGLYTATGSADAALELDFGALYFRGRGVLNFGALYFRFRRVVSKAQLAGVQNLYPLVQTGLRIITLAQPIVCQPDLSPGYVPAISL